MLAGSGADDDTLCIGAEKLLQRREAVQGKKTHKFFSQSIVGLVEAYNLTQLAGTFGVFSGVNMPHAAYCDSHSKNTGFPVWLET